MKARGAFALGIVAGGLCSALAGCSDGALDPQTGEAIQAPGGIAGEFEARIVRYRDGRSETRYLLRLADGRSRRLLFSEKPRLPIGTPLTVWATDDGQALHVDSFAVGSAGEGLGASQSALVDGPEKKARKIALVLVDTGNGLGSMTADKAKAALIGNGDLDDPNNGSFVRYYHANSYGEQAYTGEVLGPLKHSVGDCSDDAMDEMASSLRSQIATKYDQYAWYFAESGRCDWSGLGASGSPTRPARDTWYNGDLDCVVLVQEPGHNYGMFHSSSLLCDGAPFADQPEGKCGHDEYGDPFDPMGSGCYHMNMWQKQYVGWLGGCNSVKVTSSGTFDIFPMEAPCNAIQTLQIPMPHTRTFRYDEAGSTDDTKLAFFYLEYRRERPFDDPAGTLLQGVFVHVAPDYVPPTEDGLHTHILDMQPNVKGAHLPIGKTFVDPTGSPSITVVSADATKATIKVEFEGGGSGAPTCLDGTKITAPGPQSCGNGDGGLDGTGGAGGASTGMGGSQGSGGAAGASGGSAGNGGASGTGGAGTSGHAGSTPDAGVSPIGSGGRAGNTPALSGEGPSEVIGGCTCALPSHGSRDGWGAWLAIGLFGSLAYRRAGTVVKSGRGNVKPRRGSI
jgi:hypothetical protein